MINALLVELVREVAYYVDLNYCTKPGSLFWFVDEDGFA